MNRTLAVGLLFIILEGCGEASAPLPVGSPPPPPLPPPHAPDTTIRGTLRILDLPTVDGSGRVVHPDYVRMPASWTGAARFLAVTTYPEADPTREWPSIFAQDSFSTRWRLVQGTPNPLLTASTPAIYSDPDIVFEPDSGELWMYVRYVNAGWNVLQVIKSPDGVAWTAPVGIDSAPNHGMISPSVVRRGRGDWYLWSVHADRTGCRGAASTFLERRSSVDGLNWSAPDSVLISGHPWHIDVEWIPDRQEWWAVYVEGCMPTSVRFATSEDGLRWVVYPSPVLTAGVIPEFKDIVYRSSVAVEGDSARFWFSGARWDSASVTDSGWVWHVAAGVEATADLLARLAKGPAAVPRAFVPPRGGAVGAVGAVSYPEAP